MTPFSASGTPRGRRSSYGASDAQCERPASRHREDSAERFANLGRASAQGAGSIAFDNAFWQRVHSKTDSDQDFPGVPPPRPPRGVEPSRGSSGRTHTRHSYTEGERSARDHAHEGYSAREVRQQHVDDLLNADSPEHKLLDQELETRRRRAETVVGQWADELAPELAGQIRGSKSKRRNSEGMAQLEQQVAELRRRQAEQAHLVLAQEDKHRHQEERTMHLLQQQAEELQWQQQEELRLLSEAEAAASPPVHALFSNADDSSDEEEQLLGRAEEEDEDEKMRWQDAGGVWHGPEFREHRGEASRTYVDLPDDVDCSNAMHHGMPKEKENVGPDAMSDEIRSGYCSKDDYDQQQGFLKEQDVGAGHDRVRRGHRRPSQSEEQSHHRARHSESLHRGPEPNIDSIPQDHEDQKSDDMWQQHQFPDSESRRKLAEEFWQWHHHTVEEEEEQRRREVEQRGWQEAVQHERRRHQHRDEEKRQHHTQESDDYHELSREELRRQRLAKELDEERQRQKLLEERQQEREGDERRWQEALQRERLEFMREEQHRQEERERQQQEYELGERQRELEREEKRRHAFEKEDRRRHELERRRQELEREQVRQLELEREERRRQRKLKEKEDELRREQEIAAEDLRRLQREEDEFRRKLEAQQSGQPEEEANPGAAQEPQQTGMPPDSHGRTERTQGQASENPTETKPETSSPRTTLYDVLKVGKDATAEDIRKAYKRQCMKHHPDKGGNRERFEEVGQAYQILSDESLRRAYDTRGMAGVGRVKEKQKTKSNEPEKAAEKAQSIVVEAYVPLEVAYTGGSVDVQVVRIAACAPCGGSGTAPGACYMQCPSCEGQCSVQQYVQFGPMIVEQRAPCNVCAGQGMVLPSTSLCSACCGEQLVEEEVRVPFDIPRGVTEKERIVAKGQGHAMPGLMAGDVTLVCRMQEHQRFYRKGDDLLTEHTVPLQVALCGGAFEVPMLSGHSVRVRLPRGVVLQPGSMKCVPGEGMPKRQNPHLRGDLVVRFGVEFPESVSEATAARLASAFTTPEDHVAPADDDMAQAPLAGACDPTPPTPDRQDGEVYLSDFNMEEFGKSLQQEANQAYEEEDDNERARAAKAAQGLHHPFYSYSGYSNTSGFVPPGGNGGPSCRQM